MKKMGTKIKNKIIAAFILSIAFLSRSTFLSIRVSSSVTKLSYIGCIFKEQTSKYKSSYTWKVFSQSIENVASRSELTLD